MEHEKINYIELSARDLIANKTFFTNIFNWQFVDYGPEYSAFNNAGIDGGFYQSDLHASTANGGALVVFYSTDLEGTMAKIQQAGGTIIKENFSFPGGHRFHFSDPSDNEYAVWSDKSV